MNRLTAVLVILAVLALIGIGIGPSQEMQKKYPRNGLTDAQLISIVDDCTQNPDALRCQ